MNCTDVIGDKRHTKSLKNRLIDFVRDEIEWLLCRRAMENVGLL